MREDYIRLPGPLEGMVVQRDRHGQSHDFHKPLTDPGWVPSSADGRMLPGDAVVGWVVDGGAYALPWWVLKNHHVANLVFDSGPIMAVL